MQAGTPGLQAFQADERAFVEQLREGATIGQAEILRYQFGQRIQHERAGMHVVMRHFQAWLVEHLVTEQQDVQVQRAWAPALFAHAALVVFDGLQRIEQCQWCQGGVQGGDSIGVARLAGQQRIAGVQGRGGYQARGFDLVQRLQGATQLLGRCVQVAAQTYVGANGH